LKVWQAIAAIPSGETRSYVALAESIQSGARAIGNACGRNPHPVVVPCHRVIAKNGGMGGFNRTAVGGFVEIKRWLLAHEKKT
jgi:methylated-DNA-[protein]-cysteine S-methyltransferase